MKLSVVILVSAIFPVMSDIVALAEEFSSLSNSILKFPFDGFGDISSIVSFCTDGLKMDKPCSVSKAPMLCELLGAMMVP